VTRIEDLHDWRLEVDIEDIAWAFFDRENASMNTLDKRATGELARIVSFAEDAATRSEIKGLVFISGKKGNFIAGADINEFDNLQSEEEVRNVVEFATDIFNRIENLPIPVVAAIHGFCLGGGLELALACHYRVADREDITKFGFPEVKLGLIPGLNGTARAFRHLTPSNAMGIMLTGKMFDAEYAQKIGLVEQLVPSSPGLSWAARKAIRQNRRPRSGPWWNRLLTILPVRALFASMARKKTTAKVNADHYPAPFRIIDIFARHGGNFAATRAAEADAFAELMISDTSRNLRRVFRLSEMLKKQAPRLDFRPQRAHIIGAGTMGGDIAAWCAFSGMEVAIEDVSETQVDAALARANKLFKRKLRKKTLVDAAKARLHKDKDGSFILRADIIIEAVAEDLAIKQDIFVNLEKKAKASALLATNTSSLKIEEIAAKMQNPQRLIGLHFFNPVAKLPLVEVVRGKNSDDNEVLRGCNFVAKTLRKYPLVTADSPGFLVNRILAPYLLAAAELYKEGEEREKIDAAALHFGMPVGPLELLDAIGLDICLRAAEGMNRIDDSSEIHRMVQAGNLGKKTGEGFYTWKDGKADKKTANDYDTTELETLAERLTSPLFAECEICLADGVVENADLVDAGAVFGAGFAPFRGGPLNYARLTNG
jgi:3-hydroxyacyl-CoA dehydrogenase/enoyl-CoA hydratase/3-hydroxybutyryl-CoA epimerase